MANLSAFSLSFDYFGGAPCSAGRSRLSVSSNQAGILVVDQLVGEGPDYVRRSLQPAATGWRGIVSYLGRERIVAYDTDGDTAGEYPWPYAMDLKGRASLATDMVAMAWAGDPLLGLAQALTRHGDEDLEALRARYGPLQSEDFIGELLRLKHWADELLVDPDDAIARGPRFGFDFREMRRDLVRAARVERADEDAAKLRRRWQLASFEPRIAAIVLAWRRLNPPTSANTQIGMSMRSGILQRSLERYVIEHGEMPTCVVRARDDRPEWSISDFDVHLGELDPAHSAK